LARRGLLWAGAIGCGALLALSVHKFWPERSRSAVAGKAVAGRWTARVNYDWGAVHEESFVFEIDDGELHGSASYLGVPRTLEQGQLRNERLSFVTRSQEALGAGASRTVTHRYRGRLEGKELRLVLESSGGYSTHTPVEFVGRRAPR
jgi:hypothetical protein